MNEKTFKEQWDEASKHIRLYISVHIGTYSRIFVDDYEFRSVEGSSGHYVLLLRKNVRVAEINLSRVKAVVKSG